MTTELEKHFFECFGIEPKIEDACKIEDNYWNDEEIANKYGTFDVYMEAKCGNQENCTTLCRQAYEKEIYPEITDRKLLELFAIDNVTTYEELRNYILCRIIYNYENDENKRYQVKALFEDKEQ